MTSPKHWAEVQRLVEAAMEQPPAERPGFVTSACGDDESLRGQVQHLLSACEAAGSDPNFMSELAVAFAAAVVAEVAAQDGDKLAPEVKFGALQAALADRYVLEREIARGGMSVVFLATDRRHARQVAIKAMMPGLLSVASADRFLREIQVASHLAHPHILALFDSGEAEGTLYYVMPYVAGESLRHRLKREGILPLDEALRITQEVAGALSHAHKQDVVHRDIKPENILLQEGHAIVADFGIARAMNAADSGDGDFGPVIGTPMYMSPEQSTGTEAVDARSDIYSLGCVLYEMLAGKPPFTGLTPQAILLGHAEARVPPLRVLRPEVPAQLVAVVEKALAKRPDDRYSSAELFSAALVRKDRSPRWVPWVATAAAVAGGGLGIALSSMKPERPLDQNKVAIFPLEERGLDAAEGGSGSDLVIMLNAALEHADPLRPLDTRDRVPSDRIGLPVSAEAQRKIARQVGAAHYLTGVVQGHGDSITVGLRLVDTRGDSVLDQQSVTGHRRNTPMHHLGIDAVKLLLPSLVDPGRTFDLAPLRDRKTSAVALFIQGEREYRRSRFLRALDLYQRALAEDSSFAIAATKGAMAAYWNDHDLSARLAALADERATAELVQDTTRPATLPRRYASFARGLRMFMVGQADSAEHWLQRALRDAPGWPEALMALGEVYYHLIPNRPDLTGSAATQFREAVRADSGFTPPLFHLAEMAIQDGRLRDANDLVARYTTAEPAGEHAQRLRAMLGCVEAGAGSFDWAGVARANLRAALGAAKSLAVGGYQLPCAEQAFRSVLAVGADSSRFHWGAVFGLQSVLAAQQRSSEVVALVDSVVNEGPLAVMMTMYLTDAMAGLPVETQAARVAEFGRSRWGDRYAGLDQRVQLTWLQWLFGVWHTQQGDQATAAELREALIRRDTPRSPQPTARYLADALGAHLLLASGDTGRAISAFQRLAPRVPSDSLNWSQELPLAVERIVLARLLLDRGQHAAAIETAALFDHPAPMVYVAFIPASLSIRLRAAEQSGRTADAERYRTRLRNLQAGGAMQSVVPPSSSRGTP